MTSEAGRFVGGLMVGFGFFVNAHLGGHLNFELLPLVPVMLRTAEDVMWRTSGRRRMLAGVALGVATAGQALLSEEIVAIVVVGAVVVALLAVLNAPRTVLPALPRALPGLGLALLTAGALLAFPLYVQLYGPNIIDTVSIAPHYFAQARDLVVPSSRFLIAPRTEDASLVARGSNTIEDAVYVGLPMLVLLAAAIVVWRRRWPVRVAVLAAVAGFVLAMGSGLRPDGTAGWSRPAALILHQPILLNVLPVRFGLVTQLACAWVLAMVVAAGAAAARRRGQEAIGGGAALAGSALAIVTLLPAPPLQQVSAEVPTYFTSDAVDEIPDGVLIDLIPAPADGGMKAMLYQAEAGQRFWMLGSYARSQVSRGWYDTYADPDPVTVLMSTANGRPGNIGSITDDEVANTLAQLHLLGVWGVVAVPGDDPEGKFTATARRVLGTPTQAAGGALMWRLG